MPQNLHWLELALLTPVLACGAAASSSDRQPPNGAGAVCAVAADCSSGQCQDQVCSPLASDSEAPPDPGASAGARAGAPDVAGPASQHGCGSDGVFPNSIAISDQAALDQLEGCERISGYLTLHVFAGIDETPLLSLRDVDGGVLIYGGAEPVDDPLAGFSALEEATQVLLQGLTLHDLQPLARLKHIGPETSAVPSVPIYIGDGGKNGGLEIFACAGLESLSGLGALERVMGIELEDNPNLVSLSGLTQLHSLPLLVSRNCPLVDLQGLGGLGVENVSIDYSAIADLGGWNDASALQSLRLVGNDALVSVQGAQMPAHLQTLHLEDNRSLVDLRGLEPLRSAGVVVISSSGDSALESLSGLNGLTRVGTLELTHEPGLKDLSGLDALEQADRIDLVENASLVSLDALSKLQSVNAVSVLGSPALQSLAGLGNASMAGLSLAGMPHIDLTGLERAAITNSLSLSGVEQLRAPAGLPQITAAVSLSITESPLLRDLQALAPLTALAALSLHDTGLENLDALSQLSQLSGLGLFDNPLLQQVDALGDVRGLLNLSVDGNPVLTHLPEFAGAGCDPCDGFNMNLSLQNNAALQTGPSLPQLTAASSVVIRGNPVLTSVSIAALRSINELQVAQNPKLVALALPELVQANTLVIHGNAALDDTPLAPLRQLPDASVKILSNLSGPARLDPCPWVVDAVCDETSGDCAAGSDAVDCASAPPSSG